MSVATQSQALNALVFLFCRVLGREHEEFEFKRGKRGKRLPVVLSREEVKRVLELTNVGMPRTFLSVLYGCGLRVSEGLRLRVKDVDFSNKVLRVVDGKGGKDRILEMPRSIREALERQLAATR
ncbi:MAG: tyrosine-type recombinase/integrase, partial [Chthoniobacterales bacterium]